MIIYNQFTFIERYVLRIRIVQKAYNFEYKFEKGKWRISFLFFNFSYEDIGEI